jgi:transcriptional regulator with XRE-family HTH domain
MVTATASNPGELLRQWRRRRHLSQLELSLRSAVSGRHLSFIETGRARPSREMLLHLAQRLDIPLRERNRLLLAGGYAPVFEEHSLDEARMGPVREALDRFLTAHEPYPAIVVDRHWNLVAGNRGVELLTQGVAPELLAPPANALRITLHPRGMAPRIVNFDEWSGDILLQLQRLVQVTGDEILAALYDELAAFPGVDAERSQGADDVTHGVVMPLQLMVDDRELSFFSTVTTFGTPRDITLAELAIEAFYPADEATAAVLMRSRT